MNAMARLRAFWATTQGKVAIIGSGAGVAGLLGLRARNKKAAAGGGIAPAVATTPAGDTSYAGGQASGPLGPPGFGSSFLPTPSTIGTGTGIGFDLGGGGRPYAPVGDWQGPNLVLRDPNAASGAPTTAPTISAPPAASAPVTPVAIINTPPPAYTSRPAPVTGSPIASVTQRFTSPYQVATNQQLADYAARNAPAPSAPAPVAPTPVQVTSPYQVATPSQVAGYLARNAPAPAKTAPVAARPGPGPPLKGPR